MKYRSDGFTLIEVLIVFTILVFISFAISEAIWNTYRLRNRLSVEGDFYTTIRMSMALLDRDVSLMFFPKMILPNPNEKMNFQEAQNLEILLRSRIDEGSDFWGGIISKTGVRNMRFVGTSNSISFVSLSHSRIYKETPESIFAKVSYELKPDNQKFHVATQMLVRNENSNAFGMDDDKEESEWKTYPLLNGLTKFKLRYFSEDKQWNDTWDSENRAFKDIFPEKIEVTLEVVGPQKRIFDGRYTFKPELPGNGIKKTL